MKVEYSFYGHSDDIFMAAKAGRDIEECYPPQQYLLQHNDSKMVITAHYADRTGVWSIGVEPFEEDYNLPDWPLSFVMADNCYSSELRVIAPAETTLTVINADDDNAD